MENNQTEIKWRTYTTYVDVETGEVLNKEQIKEYIILNSKKQSNVYKQTGTIRITYECRRDTQLKLF